MTQAKGTIKMENVFQTVVIVLLVIVGLIGLVGNMSDEAPVVDFSAVEARLSAIETNQVNTAAGDVVVDNSIMEAKIEGFANILEDLMDDAYAEEVDQIKEDGLEAFEDEYADIDEDELDDILAELIPGYDMLRSDDFDEDFGDDGVKYTIVNLGLDDDGDKVIIVEKVLEIKYELEDTTDKLKGDVLVTGTITYDDDDEEFEADLVFSLI